MPGLYTSQVFPGGHAKTLTISPTAGNVITNLSPGVGLRWVILRGRLIITTDITVADRVILKEFTDGINLIERMWVTPAIPASQTRTVSFGNFRFNPAGLNYPDNWYTGEEPSILSNMDQLRISVGIGVAGDSYQGFVSILEMAVD